MPSAHQWLPGVFLTIPGSPWPLADGVPVGTGRVGEFTVEREIVAARLPGQVRARSGFSIGDARVTVQQAPGRPLAPWARPDRRVEAGAECLLYAMDETTGARWPLGAWQTKAPAGSLTSAQVGVELIESQYAGRMADARLPVVDGEVDPVWIVDVLARQAGFHSTPPPGPGTVLNVPLCGALAAGPNGSGARLTIMAAGKSPQWSTASGIPGLSGAAELPRWHVPRPAGSSRQFERMLITANIAGTVRFQLQVGSGSDLVDVEVTTGTVRARMNGGAWTATRTFAAGMDPNWPTRVQVILGGTGPQLTIAARSSANATPSTPVTVTPLDLMGVSTLAIAAIQSGAVSALDVTLTDTNPTHMWAAPTARMSLLDGRVFAAWIPDPKDVWSTLQATLDAYAGAGWVSLGGVLTVLNRHELAGSGRPKTQVDVGSRVEDLSWTLDADDYADRLEVTWWPVTWPEEDELPQWPVGDKLHVPARRSQTVEVDLGAFVRQTIVWVHVDSEFLTTDVASRWDANTAVDGSGVSVSTGIHVASERTTPSTVRVTVTNQNPFDVWMVDFNGNPSMILRGAGKASQESPQVIEYGTPDVDAKSPLTIDLGKTVQDRATAEELAGYLWGRVNRPRYRLNAIRMPLDWSRDLGDVLTLVHPESDLVANVLVVRDAKTGGPGEIAQRCDLILLPPTVDDFEAVWAGKTFDDFEAQWAGQNLAAFDADPLMKTEA